MRDRVIGPVEINTAGFKGDKATQPFHGTADLAVCCHFLDHYRFWKAHYDLDLQPGDVGENICLENIFESEVCIGDIYQVGTTRLQVSSPRSPCATQARHVGRPDWVKLTIKELRTGFYMRVIEPGTTQAGDEFKLLEHMNPKGTIHALNHCNYQKLDPDLAQQFSEMPELSAYWKNLFAEKLAK
jgi:MOSC domain-containing protein YiiM